MKNIISTLFILAAITLAIAVSSGKLGGISDLEARRVASEPFTR